MYETPVIAIFDIGKTNKKLFLFDEDYNIVYEESTCFAEVTDDDGDACESLESLQSFVISSLQKVFQNKAFKIRAVNFATYGASFVHLNANGKPVTPLYNYLKVYPKELLKQFYDTYGGEITISIATASPMMGHLNSGMQLYWLKYAKPLLYSKIAKSLHLPQYLSFLLTINNFSELTSIGCHTTLWDFSKHQYHTWVYKEGIIDKLAPIISTGHVTNLTLFNQNCTVGIGLHDSSAALIPYLAIFQEPFILISTGTWCISLNPFNQSLLTYKELQQDCLCYLTYEGKPVKASRLFSGNEHEQQVKRLAAHFNKPLHFYKTVQPIDAFLKKIDSKTFQRELESQTILMSQSSFARKALADFATYEEAYHQLILDLIYQQVQSTLLVLKETNVKRLYVDGGFGKNAIYMHLLAEAFPELEVFAATMPQATAIGAAMAIHDAWNNKPLVTDIIKLKKYSIE